jgi:glutamyl/glutaminyl-tRNA synthetase
MLEHALRDDLNKNAPRAMAVLRPLKVVIENLPEGHVEMLRAEYHPELDLGARDMSFTRELFIDQDDFKEEYSKKFKKKFTPGNRIRLRHSYVIEATGYEKDAAGNFTVADLKTGVVPTAAQVAEDRQLALYQLAAKSVPLVPGPVVGANIISIGTGVPKVIPQPALEGELEQAISALLMRIETELGEPNITAQVSEHCRSAGTPCQILLTRELGQ